MVFVLAIPMLWSASRAIFFAVVFVLQHFAVVFDVAKFLATIFLVAISSAVVCAPAITLAVVLVPAIFLSASASIVIYLLRSSRHEPCCSRPSRCSCQLPMRPPLSCPRALSAVSCPVTVVSSLWRCSRAAVVHCV